MTLIIASVHGEVPEDLGGADLLELRIDAMDPQHCIEQLPKELAASPIPTIVTCRSIHEGGMFDGEEEERINMYQAAMQCETPPLYIDIEHETLKQHPLVLHALSSEHTRIILSWHDMRGRPQDLIQRAAAMQDVAGVDVVKMVWRARSIRDNFEAFDLLQSRQQPMIAMCVGPYGVMSRVLAPKFGGFATYASIDGHEPTASGQVSVRELRSVYNFDEINKDTKVYGVVGNNVEHSASPAFHNAAFQAAGTNAIYLPLQIASGWEHLKASVGELQHYELLHFSGASITIPHKEDMMELAQTHDAISSKVGATNTIAIHGNVMHANNTDVSALKEFGEHATNVLVLGGGGVARAAIVAMKELGATVHVATRRETQAESLANNLSCEIAHGEIDGIDTVINCTPIGMEGGKDPQGNPLSALAPWLTLNSSILAIDTVYMPERTPFITLAEESGCRVVLGSEMFRIQATQQQEIWALTP
jgi:3-dehydroquinate dehydratase/shikimate dehydrogenase